MLEFRGGPVFAAALMAFSAGWRENGAMAQQLLYVSNTALYASPAMLDDILAASRRNNSAAGITGMLLYVEGGFLQVLEGEADRLDRLYQKIVADRRHWNAHVLIKREAAPLFCDWSMGFHRLARQDGAMFQISADAIAGHIGDGDQMVLLSLMENFYRIQSGEKGFGARAD